MSNHSGLNGEMPTSKNPTANGTNLGNAYKLGLRTWNDQASFGDCIDLMSRNIGETLQDCQNLPECPILLMKLKLVNCNSSGALQMTYSHQSTDTRSQITHDERD